ncbi:MAG: hypothetical protein JSS14_23230 [Proteobacteria bacterium]|nr:hypothetical protein [Pseudomonadota bacterium]
MSTVKEAQDMHERARVLPACVQLPNTQADLARTEARPIEPGLPDLCSIVFAKFGQLQVVHLFFPSRRERVSTLAKL